MAISVRDWANFSTKSKAEGMAQYEQSVALLAEHVIDNGFKVSFVSTCQGRPEYWTDDSVVAQRIVNRLSRNAQSSVVVDREAHNPEELREIFGSFDAVLATRLHAAILALAGGTPVLPIAYEFKTFEVFNQLDLSEWVIDIESVTPEVLISTFDRFVEGTDQLRTALSKSVPELRLDAQRTAILLREVLTSHPQFS